ncbi:MAG: hypothetical protein FJX74_11605 [Armatimonadetes bacterium]|nr:hypothetical protein [Armatimonadota bacterium]
MSPLRVSLRLPTLLAALIPLAVRAPADDPRRPSATVSVTPVQERALTGHGEHDGHRFHTRTAPFGFGAQPYAISYQACVDAAHGDQVVPLEGYIGMPQPCSTNWYHGGFLFVRLNGQDIGAAPLSSMAVAESGTRAILDMVWHHPLATVRVRFLGLPDHDGLFCEIALDPRQELTTLEVSARCYPSYFTSWNRRDGARRVQTPGALIEQGTPATLPASEAWWAVYYDEVFDVANGEGDGPCALALLPQEAAEVEFRPTDYPVETRITYPPDRRRLHLAFWEFPGSPNAEVLARLRADGTALRAELETADFTPAAVRALDLAALRADVDRATRSEAVRAYLGERLTEVQTWVAEAAPAGEPAGDPLSIEAEEKLLASVGKYYGFMWEVKLAELLAGL